MDKESYAKKNRAWIEAKAGEADVYPLGAGVFYRRIRGVRSQSAPRPRASDVVTVHYTGRTINGKQFDSSRGGVPVPFRLRDLINGWRIALVNMRVGERWEVYIPSEQGYGKRSMPGIPGGSVLVFDIELIGVN